MVRGIPLSNTNSENTRHIIGIRRLNHTHNFASQPGGPEYDNPIKRTGPPGYIGLRNRFL
jgi:hypothetical protein